MEVSEVVVPLGKLSLRFRTQKAKDGVHVPLVHSSIVQDFIEFTCDKIEITEQGLLKITSPDSDGPGVIWIIKSDFYAAETL